MTSIEKLANSFRYWEAEWKKYEEGILALRPLSFNEFVAPFIEMHKQEIIDAFDNGDHCIDLPDGSWEQKYKSAEQYYQETFKKK